MTERPLRYRILDRPGPASALVEDPAGGIARWWLEELPIGSRLCAQCGRRAWRCYLPAPRAGTASVCLCRPCVERVPVG